MGKDTKNSRNIDAISENNEKLDDFTRIFAIREP